MADAVGDVFSPRWAVGSQPHDVVVVDDALVADVVESLGNLEHVQVSLVGRDLGVGAVGGDGAFYVAEVDVEETVLAAEVADTIEDVLAGLVACADTEGDAVTRAGHLAEEPVEGREVDDDLGVAEEGGHGRVVTVSGDLDSRFLGDGNDLSV